MTTVERRFEFVVDEDVKRDLYDMRRENPDQAAIIVAILEELNADPSLCERLVDPHFADDQVESIEPFWALQTRRYNAFRVRIIEVDDWRLITAADHRSRRVALLYIMRRDEDYDDEVQRRCIAAYEKLGLWIMGT